MISRQGIFLEYTSIAKQQGKIDGVSGVPILSVPEFTRLIRELFPTSQLINDAQNRQVFSGIQVKEPSGKKPSGKKTETPSTPPANGFPPSNGTATPPKGENGHHNGVNSFDEDSNHSQQSLDSVGGGGGTGVPKKVNKTVPKSESLPLPETNEKENDPIQANGQKSELSTKTELDEISSSPQKSPRLTNGDNCDKEKSLNGHAESNCPSEVNILI